MVIRGALLLFALGGSLFAQGVFRALEPTPINGPFIAGYVNSNAVAWSFAPTTDLLVTGISSTAPEVSFWQGTNQIFATYNYAGPYGSLLSGPPTNYQAISPFVLSAGQTYSISTQDSSPSSTVNFFIFGPITTPFATSVYIREFSSYYISPSGKWDIPFNLGFDNVHNALIGPNFQFQVIPESPSLSLLALCSFIVFWHRTVAPACSAWRIRRSRTCGAEASEPLSDYDWRSAKANEVKR